MIGFITDNDVLCHISDVTFHRDYCVLLLLPAEQTAPKILIFFHILAKIVLVTYLHLKCIVLAGSFNQWLCFSPTY